ncbi:MAG TPA: hypothetical protein PK625_00135 [Spirochaetales bacterium]|nr:hypothetical protein [Spirochaetales bacterium]
MTTPTPCLDLSGFGGIYAFTQGASAYDFGAYRLDPEALADMLFIVESYAEAPDESDTLMSALASLPSEVKPWACMAAGFLSAHHHQLGTTMRDRDFGALATWLLGDLHTPPSFVDVDHEEALKLSAGGAMVASVFWATVAQGWA